MRGKLGALFGVLFVLLGAFFVTRNTGADGNVFKIANAIITDKTAQTEAEIVGFTDSEITNRIKFHALNEYVSYGISLKNSNSKSYDVLKIIVSGDNQNLGYEYNEEINQKIAPGDAFNFEFKAIYKTLEEDINERNQDVDISFVIYYKDESKNEETEVIIISPGTTDEENAVTPNIDPDEDEEELPVPNTNDSSGVEIPDTGANMAAKNDGAKDDRISPIFPIIAATIIVAIIMYLGKHKRAAEKTLMVALALGLAAPFTLVNASDINEDTIAMKSETGFYDRLVVTYKTDEGAETRIINYADLVNDIADPQNIPEGYEYDGYEYDEDGDGNGDGVKFDSTVPITEDINIVPSYKPIMYTVKFDKNDANATGEMASIIKEYLAKYNLPNNAFEKTGYEFMGWNTQADGNGTHYDDAGEVEKLQLGGELTLYAEWLESIAMLNTGSNINRILKELTNREFYGNNLGIEDLEMATRRFTKSPVAPDEETITEWSVNIAADDSNFPVYVWPDEYDFFLHWWSQADTVYLNPDSSNMFSGFVNINIIDIENFDTSRVTNMSRMFWENRGLVTINLSNMDTSNVTDMSGLFEECIDLTTIDISNFNTQNVTTMARMFAHTKFTSLDLSGLNTNKVEDFTGMFERMKSLETLNVDGLVTSAATTMEKMFNTLPNLTSLSINNFDTQNVRSFYATFYDVDKITSLDLSDFNTSSATTMYTMFSGCESLTSLDVTSFDTGNVTDMRFMFSSLDSIEELDVSSFDTHNVTKMQNMFLFDVELRTIYASDKFTLDSISDGNASGMFGESRKIVGGAGTTYISGEPKYAKIDGGEGDPGYFTYRAPREIIYNDDYWAWEGEMTNDIWKKNGYLKPNAYISNGYHFVGWALESGGVKVYDDQAPMNTLPEGDGPITLYAVFEPNRFTVVFHANNDAATGTMDPFEGDMNTYQNMPKSIFVLEGYRVASWLYGENTYIPNGGSTAYFYAENDGDVFDLYAQWEIIPPGIDYIANLEDVEGEMNRQEPAVGSEVLLRAPNFRRTGYGFLGWNTEPDGTGTMYGTNEQIVMPEDGLKLYAIWAEADQGATMQSFNSAAEPYVSAPSFTSIALTDSRDNETYTITKMPDGQWWMTENLRLITKDKTINASNTNNPQSAFLRVYNNPPVSSMCIKNDKSCVEKTSYNANNMTLTNISDTFNYRNGIYYNAFMATAGNSRYNQASYAEGDICPIGWHLPKENADNSSDFTRLNSILGEMGYEEGGRFVKYPFNVTLLGFAHSNAVSDGSSSSSPKGYYYTNRSSTGETYMGVFDLNSSYRSANKLKYIGGMVRCIAD